MKTKIDSRRLFLYRAGFFFFVNINIEKEDNSIWKHILHL